MIRWEGTSRRAPQPNERERLICQHLPLVRGIARTYACRGVEEEDLVQVGAIGLINAVDRFDCRRGASLRGYATMGIVSEIRRYLRDGAAPIRLPRRVQQERAAVRRAEQELAGSLGRSPRLAELAARAGLPAESVREAIASDGARAPVALSDPEAGAAEAPASDFRGASDNQVVVGIALRALDARQRRVIELRFFEDRSQAEIAQALGCSQVHVSRLMRAALDRLRADLDHRGVAPGVRGA